MLRIGPFGDIKMLVELTRVISGEPHGHRYNAATQRSRSG